MRQAIATFLAVMILTAATSAFAAEAKCKAIKLFGPQKSCCGKVLWKAIGETADADADAIWERDGDVLVLKAGPKGYIRTEADYTNFTLTLEFRRPEGKEPGKGGILFRITGEDRIWPKSLEAQINSPDAGDFWGLCGYKFEGPADRFMQLEHDTFGTLRNLKTLDGTEKPIGQWNTYTVIADGDTVTLKINGKVVNKATGCDVVAGKICLTAEGDEIHFRNVKLVPMAD